MQSLEALVIAGIRDVLQGMLVGSIYVYRMLISPVLPRSCRFWPTCSEYAVEAVRRYGILKGVALAARRLLRCHPLGGSGADPVP